MRQILRKGKKAAKKILKCLDDSCTSNRDPVFPIASQEGSSSTPCIEDATLVVKERADPQQALQDAEAAAEGMKSLAGCVQYIATAAQGAPADLDTADNVQDTYLRPLKIFDAVIEEIANVHPYTKMALGVLSRASKIILAQADRDKAVLELFNTMHIRTAVFDEELAKEVRLFFNHERLFFWLELLGLVNALSGAGAALSLIAQWSKGHSAFKDVSSTPLDMQRFIQVFGGIILHSTPDLYVSALPFSPTNSVLSGAFSARFPNTLCVSSRRDMDWPAVLAVLRGHDGPVNSFSFSPDGTRIVAGSLDITVRLWDAATGQPVGEPSKGYTRSVNSVSFFPDGTCIVTGSHDSTVRPWDVPTREPMQQCAGPDHSAFLYERHIMHPIEATTTMTSNPQKNHAIRFSSDSTHALHNTAELTEGAPHDDHSLTPFSWMMTVDGW